MPKSSFTALLTATGLVLLGACSDSNNNSGSNPPPTNPPVEDAIAYQVSVHRTEGGVVHMVANDFDSIGFGTGYAAAQDNFCELARNLLKYRASLSRYLGPDDGNLDSDFFYQLLIDQGAYDHEIDGELDAQFRGYAAGFNRYLRDVGVDSLSDPACRGADWIQAMSHEDVRRIHMTPAFLPNFAGLILPAEPPPEAAQASAPEAMSQRQKYQLAAVAHEAFNGEDRGSNGVGIGRELSSNGLGMLYTNPHLGWDGFGFRMYAMHQIIPGVTNMLGANTAERANVGYGTNGDVAWTNTVTTSSQFAFYRLSLVDPLTYLFDDEPREIESIKVSVESLGQDGNLTREQHTFYKSHFGFMIGGAFPWTDTQAFTLRIVDEGVRALQGGALALQRAGDVRELKAALNQYQMVPVNTVAADRNGDTLYGDLGPVVNFTDQQLQDCRFVGPVFHGDSSACEWNTDSDSAAPGLLGASKQAFLVRPDYVTNSNDSYWLANPEQPITGIAMVQGDVEDERTLRTRSGLEMVDRRQQGGDGLAGNLFDLDGLIERMLANENYAGRILRDDLVILCEANPEVDLDGEVQDIGGACPVLKAWDLSSNLDSRGAHLFREFMRFANDGSSTNRWLPDSLNTRIPFDVNDPVITPSGLDTQDNTGALTALAEAVRRLDASGIALDARLGDIQYVVRNGERIPMHGGEEMEGVFNKMSLDFVEGEGYPDVTGSSASWIMAVQFTEDGVKARGVLARSMSTNTESEHYSDMTRMLSEKHLAELPYTAEEVEAAATSTVQLSEGTQDCVDDGWQQFASPAFDSEQQCRDYYTELSDSLVTDYID